MADLILDVHTDETGALVLDELTLTSILVFKTASDALDLGIEEGETVPFIENFDDLYISLVETSSILVKIQSSDSLNLAINEAQSRSLGGTFVKYASDVLTTSLSDFGAVVVSFKSFVSNDTLLVDLGEQATVKTFRQIYAGDVLDLNLTDIGVLGSLGVESLYANDSLVVSLTEQVRKVQFIQKYSGDQLGINLSEIGSINSVQDELSWEDDNVSWGGITLGYGRKPPIFLSGRNFFQMEIGRGFNGAPIKTVLERTGLTVVGRARDGSPRNDPTSIKLIRALYPMIRGREGEVIQISVGAQQHPDEAISWEGPFDFIIGQDVFIDPLVSGRYIAVRFESHTLDGWQLMSYDLDLTIVGRN